MVAGLLICCVSGAFSQASSPDAGAEPDLQRRRQISDLLGQANMQLYFHRDLEAAKARCNEVLHIDPQNAEAKFYLDLIDKRLTGPEPVRSPISALPVAGAPPEATTGTAPAATPTPAAAPAVAPAGPAAPIPEEIVVHPIEPSPAGWPSQTLALWGALALLAVLLLAALLLVVERLIKNRRKVVIEAPGPAKPVSPEMKTAPAAVVEREYAPGTIDDFPIGPEPSALTIESDLAPAESVPSVSGEDTADYWNQGARKTPAVPPPPAPPPSAEEEEFDAAAFIPAHMAFGPESEPPPAKAESEPRRDESSSGAFFKQIIETERGMDDIEAPGEPIARDTDEDSDVPIVIEAVSKPSAAPARPPQPAPPPASRPAADKADEALFRLREDALEAGPPVPAAPRREAELQSLPFSLEGSLDETEYATDAGFVGMTEQESIDAPMSRDDNTSLRVEDDFPTSPKLKPDPMRRTPAAQSEHDEIPIRLGENVPVRSQDDALLAELPAAHHEEILITPGTGGALDETQLFAGDVVTADSTMINKQARPRAIFQDQLARGLAAMERGHWKDAVKHLAIAHAMNPTDDYALTKLTEARKHRNGE